MKKRMLLVGGTGTLGSILHDEFREKYDVIVASRRSEKYSVDLADSQSIKALLDKVGDLNAIVCTGGEAKWAPYNELTEEDYDIGLRSKLMGQVNLARIGQDYLVEGGSISLTTGILADDPVAQTASAAMVNGALHSFVLAAALETAPGIRLNAVSCGLVENSYEKYKNYFPGHVPISTKHMIAAYVRSVEGRDHGKIIRMY